MDMIVLGVIPKILSIFCDDFLTNFLSLCFCTILETFSHFLIFTMIWKSFVIFLKLRVRNGILYFFSNCFKTLIF